MTTDETFSEPLTALVLAASRQGVDDPVAKIQNKSHKCMVTIDGIAMIERVVQTLIDSGCFARILVSIESEQVLADLPATKRWLREGTIEIVPSCGNLADSVVSLTRLDKQPIPLVITTADNVLHTPELIRYFVAAFARSAGDAAVATTPQDTVLSAYPEGEFGFFQFKDGGYSFCNLFGVGSTDALAAATIFRTGGQFRKHPWRVLKVFGLVPLILLKWRLITLNNFSRRITRKLGITVDIVRLPFAFAPVDVDNPRTYEFCQRTLTERRKAAE
jgi:CTP:molybdopterin cytidylyltransferase MocA